jgi:outer membrane PBP1 activator LpoA protein
MIAGLQPAAAISVLDNAALSSNPEKAFALLEKALEIAIQHEPAQAVDQRLKSLFQRYPGRDKSVRLAILKNRILLARMQPGKVIENLDALLPLATPREKLAIGSLKAEALLQAGFPIESVQLRISLDDDYGKFSPDEQAENDSRLWNSLMQVQPELISGYISEIPDTFSGWLELANITTRYRFDGNSLNTELDKWIARNPGHPANRQMTQHIRKKHIATSKHPERVALVLPLSGKLGPVGKAVRDGFMSAYLESSRIFGTRITIDIYDSQGNAEQARQAVILANQRQTDFIIGPLDRKAVSAALDANRPSLPDEVKPATANQQALPVHQPASANMLTLNRITGSMLDEPPVIADTDAGPDIYQFDLAPETEAQQVAERANQQGLTYAMVIVPENVWGNRIYEAFTTRYQELGGQIVATQRFKKGTADFSSNIQQGLKLSLSKIRHKQLENLLHEDIGFTPRRRQDIDIIFIAASPYEARLIKPQLKFFYADDIPVYATSSIYSGNSNPDRDKDLENVRFGDMPWVLTDKPSPGSLQRTVQTSWPQESAKYLRFYALGSDAFLLLPQLGWLKDNSNDWLPGGTGKLSLDEAGVIQRQLSWARFENAVPVLHQGIRN